MGVCVVGVGRPILPFEWARAAGDWAAMVMRKKVFSHGEMKKASYTPPPPSFRINIPSPLLWQQLPSPPPCVFLSRRPPSSFVL